LSSGACKLVSYYELRKRAIEDIDQLRGAGVVEGVIESTLVDPYNWAYNYQNYIPIIDEGAKAAVWLKGLGDPERWFS